MELIVFHYHLLPGGVTDVILHSIQAVVSHRSDITRVRLVTGRGENGDLAISRLSESGVPASLDVLEDLDYSPASESTEIARERAERLESALLEQYAGDNLLWWVHNYHVGKNPSFTLALCRIAALESAPRMLLHIHDFPECARYENLAFLGRVAGDSPYPAGPSVQYAVINARDHALMRRTGIPDARIHLLVNPLPPVNDPEAKRPDRSALVTAFARFAGRNGQTFDPQKALLLYPVRTIRRKNVLEMAMFARLCDSANLIVTLPGLSAGERRYSDLVAETFADGATHGIFGIGRQEEEYGVSFNDITRGADAVVSSSVQEGFGLLFINALRWRVPLFARHLPVLDGVQSVFEEYPAHFYETLQVPMSCPGISSVGAYLRMRYTERLDELEDLLPGQTREVLDDQLDEMLSGASIDFGYLPPDLQYPYLRAVADPGFAAEVRRLNQPSLDALTAVQSQPCPDLSGRIEEMFGFGAFSATFAAIMSAFDLSGSSPAAGGNQGRFELAQESLVREFANLNFLRLLFAPMGVRHE